MKKLNETTINASEIIYGVGRDPWVYGFMKDTGELYVAKKSSLSGKPGMQDYKWIRLKSTVSEEDYDKALRIVKQLKATQDKPKKQDNKKEDNIIQTNDNVSLAKDYAIQIECMDNLWTLTSTPDGNKLFKDFKSNPLNDDEAGAAEFIKTKIMPVILKELQKIKNTNNFEISTNSSTIKRCLTDFYKTVKHDRPLIQKYTITDPVSKKTKNKNTNQTLEQQSSKTYPIRWQYFNL